MREIRRRLSELKKENEELKNFLILSGKNRQEYEAKVIFLSHNFPHQFPPLSFLRSNN